MPTIKLTYFNIQGPAEPTRLCLTIGGIPFEDVRVDREQMLKMREEGKLDVGCAGSQVPLLEVDGKPLQQSQAQASYAAKLAKLYPEDPWLAAKCDECIQFIGQDVRDRVISPTMREEDEEKKKKMRAELHETKLPEKFAILEKIIEANGSGYLVGPSLTVADLHCYVLLNWIGMGTLDGVTKDCILKFPKLTALVKTINEMEKVKAWNTEKNPKLPWC